MPARPLSIVAAALESRAPALKSLARGQILCKEGDPAGPLYVICSGEVRALRRAESDPEAVEELARLGPGDVVGEMSHMLQKPRSATLEATEDTLVLEVQPGQIGTVLRRHGSLRRVLTVALRDRAGLSPEQITSLAARVGVGLQQELEDDMPPPVVIPTPAHDPDLVYPKAVDCPACGARFSALMLHPRNDRPTARSSDFHRVYRTAINPYDFEIWVCPNDLYAALPADFPDLSAAHRARVDATVAEVVAAWGGERPDFNVMRSVKLREQALELALALYEMRGLPPARIAAIMHRIAWCARERNDTANERDWLTRALHAYMLAYRASILNNSRDELRVVYLCGELNLRTGNRDAAIRWFNEGVRHPQIKQHAHWQRILRERWALAREQEAVAA
jgi:uncharacterized protein (DUF2225 family)